MRRGGRRNIPAPSSPSSATTTATTAPSSAAPTSSSSSCPHSIVVRGMCGKCGLDLTKLKDYSAQVNNDGKVSMVHTVPELRVSVEHAHFLHKADEDRLLNQRKLVLLVDLDQTLIHTTNDMVPENLKDVFHFQLPGHGPVWYHTRVRPGIDHFLQTMGSLYELHICTFGTRSYAHIIANKLDPERKHFLDRILSRDECFSQNSKTANLKELFPRGDHMVCIIDDREDVWNYAPNLIHVKPYHFFRHTGDINAPEGLQKRDEDDKTGFTFDRQGPHSNSTTANEEPSAVKVRRVTSDLSLSDDEDDEEDEKDDKEKSEETPKDGENEKDVPIPIPIEEKDDVQPKPDLPATNPVSNNNVIDVPDPDDYLLYLEKILEAIHSAFYTLYDEKNQVPDVKTVVPYVKRKVLKNVNIVFSGVIPTQVRPEDRKNTRAYQIALSLGAHVTENIVWDEGGAASLRTTHVVAQRLGTVKVNDAKKYKRIYVVTPEWLWCCNERWEKVDERLFELKGGEHAAKDNTKKDRYPPPPHSQLHHIIPPHRQQQQQQPHSSPVPQPSTSTKQRNNSASSSGSSTSMFKDSLNPLLSFSMDEIESMGHEVDDIINESEEEEEEASSSSSHSSSSSSSASDEEENDKSMDFNPSAVRHSLSSSSSSDEDNKEDSRKRRKRLKKQADDEISPIERFHQGEVPSEIEEDFEGGSSDEDEAATGDTEMVDEEEQWMADSIAKFIDEPE